MAIFDGIVRDKEGPAAHTDTHFAYLSRSNRPEAEKVRRLIETWVSHYDGGAREALISRLRSPIDDVHKSAFFELTLHELLVATHHKIVAIEPTLIHTTKRPDFLVEAENGTRFYLEAVISTGRSARETAAQNRLNQVKEEIDRRRCPYHFLDLSVEGVPERPVSLRQIRRRLDEWIAQLPQGAEALAVEPFSYSEHEVTITITAIPKNKASAEGRAIGVQWMGARWSTPGDGIREAVGGKANRYGALNTPYVVAVNAFGLGDDEEDAMDAMLGSPSVVVRTYDDGHVEYEDSRTPDGVWWGKKGPRNTGLSAIISTEQLVPWNVAQRSIRVIRNPWPKLELPETGLRMPQFNPIDGKMVRIDGEGLGGIFGLASDWPG